MRLHHCPFLLHTRANTLSPILHMVHVVDRNGKPACCHKKRHARVGPDGARIKDRVFPTQKLVCGSINTWHPVAARRTLSYVGETRTRAETLYHRDCCACLGYSASHALLLSPSDPCRSSSAKRKCQVRFTKRNAYHRTKRVAVVLFRTNRRRNISPAPGSLSAADHDERNGPPLLYSHSRY
jgi:hypothetical protein